MSFERNSCRPGRLNRRSNHPLWGGPVVLAMLSGCSNMSGLGGSSEMTCAAPPGVPCQSVSGVHANASVGNLPSQRPASAASAEAGRPSPEAFFSTAAPRKAQLLEADGEGGEAVATLGAIRSEPTLIRIWMAPWEDSDGDLHSDSYVYLQVDSGRWLVEHNRERIRRQFTPMPAPVSSATAAPVTNPGSASKAAAPAPAAPTFRPTGGTQR
jgi:conjugal transfer pilus assembly protein TraV